MTMNYLLWGTLSISGIVIMLVGVPVALVVDSPWAMLPMCFGVGLTLLAPILMVIGLLVSRRRTRAKLSTIDAEVGK